jgi:hypothetical protein
MVGTSVAVGILFVGEGSIVGAAIVWQEVCTTQSSITSNKFVFISDHSIPQNMVKSV